jgi:hypothetical protein
MPTSSCWRAPEWTGTKHDVTLREKIEGTASVHLARDRVMRSLPTQLAFREHLTDLREDAKRMHDRIVASRAFWFAHNGFAPDSDMLVVNDAFYEKLLRNLDGIVAALGPPPSTAKGTAHDQHLSRRRRGDRDKAHLVELFEALHASPSVLRRNDDGLWTLRGGCDGRVAEHGEPRPHGL